MTNPIQQDLFQEDIPDALKTLPPPLPVAPPNFVEAIKNADALVESVDISADSFAPWSFSKYKSLKKCPFQFYLKYILKFKIPETLLLQSDPISANVGKAAHEILESVLIGKSVDAAYDRTRKEYLEKGLLTEKDWVIKVDSLHYNILQFKERIDNFSLGNPVKRIFTELRMGITKEYEPTGFFSKDVYIRGVIDLVLVLECLDAVIFDHKTGGGEGSVKNYEEQLDWYKILFHFGISKVRGAQTAIHFIGAGDVKMASYTHVSDIESNLKNSLEMSLEGAVEMLKEKGYFKHVRGSYCKWCEYDNIGCKSGELKPLELATKRWIEIKKA